LIWKFFFVDDNLRSWVVHALDGEIPLCSWSPMSWTSFNLQVIGCFPPLITGVLNPLDTWNGDAVPHDIPILSRDIPLPRCLTWFQSLNYHGAAKSRTWNIPWNHLLKLFRSPCFAVADYCTLVFFSPYLPWSGFADSLRCTWTSSLGWVTSVVDIYIYTYIYIFKYTHYISKMNFCRCPLYSPNWALIDMPSYHG